MVMTCILASALFLLWPRGPYVSSHGPVSVGSVLLSLPLTGAVYLAVRLGHCRNSAVLITASFVVVLVLFFAYLLCGFLAAARPIRWASLNRFPDYVVERIYVNVRRDAAGNLGPPSDRAPA
jgi:hypothetical protein